MKNKNQAGFSIIETIIAMSLGALMALMLMMVTIHGLKYIREIHQQERLQANAVFLSNKFSYWVKQGATLDSPSLSELRIVLSDGSEKVFTMSGNDITLDGSSLISDEVEITSLVFTPMAKSVKVNLNLKAKGANVEFLLISTFAQRNI
jgi:hypothetical protein